ncbi:hypothetical protein [Pseudoduganella buxea]|nr:hypothetical protein [Pseudoduganella buxea]MTV56171.1 hypothetical protein [Pseudoduganella buxea]
MNDDKAMMQLTEAEYRKRFDGYIITDCAVLKRGQYYFVSRNIAESERAGPTAEATVTKRVGWYFPFRTQGSRIQDMDFEGYRTLTIGASRAGEHLILCVSVDGQVTSTDGGEEDNDEDENVIPKSIRGPRRGAMRRLRTIDDSLYAVGSDHTVCVRRGRNRWESLCLNLPEPTLTDFNDVERSDNMAFVDIDGFSENDIYVIAGKGRVWHFDGTKWSRIAFPSDMDVYSICCAGDGYVYIGGQSGSVWRGRNNEWTLLVREMLTLPFEDIVWHAGKVWLTSDYGLWNVIDGQLVEADLPSSDIKVCAGNLSVGDGVMLMAGTHGAAVHDGSVWQLIFHRMQFA